MAVDVRSRWLSGGVAELGATAEPREVLGAGALAGLVGGVAMAVAAMLFTGVTGSGAASWLQAIAATLYGPQAMIRVDAVVVGGMIHFGMSALLGVLFGAMAPRAGALGTLAAGLCFALVIWAIATFGVVPLVNPVLQARVAMQPGGWFLSHLAFGAALVTLMPLRNSFRVGGS